MRNSKSTIGKGFFVAAVAAVCVVGFSSATQTAEAKRPGGGLPPGGIYCLDVWRPVICPNGQIYSNDCYALRAGQTGCVPWGGDIM